MHELNALLLAFDEQGTGTIGKRAFQIACHRSRLLANMHENDIERLALVLSTEGGGNIMYMPFMVHVKVVSSKCMDYSDDVVPGSISFLFSFRTYFFVYSDIEIHIHIHIRITIYK